MTREDSKIIFNNVSELAVFADELSADLEKALGDVLEGGTGEDWVGKLFLQKVRFLIPISYPRRSLHADSFMRSFLLITPLCPLRPSISCESAPIAIDH